MGIRVVGRFQFQLLRHLPHAVTEEEVQVVRNAPTLRLVHKVGFVCPHVGAALHHGADNALYLVPVHREPAVFQCGRAVACGQPLSAKPHGQLPAVIQTNPLRVFVCHEFKSFSCRAVFLFQELRHLLRRFPLPVLGIDALAAVVTPAA